MNPHTSVEQRTERKIIACTRCLGEGFIYVYSPDDIFRRLDPEEEVCPVCRGIRLVVREITTTTTLSPFKPQKKQLDCCRNNCQTAAPCECDKVSNSSANEQAKAPSKYD